MSKFIELHLLHDKDPIMVNLDDVRWIGRTEQGNAVIKYIPRKEKDGNVLTVYEETYEAIKKELAFTWNAVLVGDVTWD